MDVIGIIAEYNPFHNGHIYHINKIKELYPNSLIILVLNGYFLERGEVSTQSVLNKTKLALEHDVDIVIELPFIFGSNSADIFSEASIELLHEMKVNKIIFGSESDDVNKLINLAKKQLDTNYNDSVKQYLELGINYPTALNNALKHDIKTPNDILGLTYIKSILKNNYNIEPITIKRTNDYHDTLSTDNIISATNIRTKLNNEEDISNYLPQNTIEYLNNITNDSLFNLLKFKILTDQDLSIYLDVDEGIEYRILKYINISHNFDELITNIKTKRYTYNKINRMLLHILIGLTKQDNKNTKLDYLKILGFTLNGQVYLNKIKKDITLPTTPPKESIVFKYELKAAYLYEQATKKSLNNYDLKNIPTKRDN